MLGSCTILIRCWKKSCRPRCQTAWCTRVVTLTKEIEQFASTYQSIRLWLKRRRVVGPKRASYRRLASPVQGSVNPANGESGRFLHSRVGQAFRTQSVEIRTIPRFELGDPISGQ